MEKLTSRQWTMIFKLGSFPAALELIEQHGIMEDSPEIAFGHNKTNGNVYIWLNCGLAVFTFEGRFQPGFVWTMHDNAGSEVFTSQELDDYCNDKANADFVADNSEAIQDAREAFKLWEGK